MLGRGRAAGNFGDAVDLLTRAIKQCAARELRTEMEEAKRRRLLSTLLSNRAAVYAQQSRFTHSLADASAAIQMVRRAGLVGGEGSRCTTRFCTYPVW